MGRKFVKCRVLKPSQFLTPKLEAEILMRQIGTAIANLYELKGKHPKAVESVYLEINDHGVALRELASEISVVETIRA